MSITSLKELFSSVKVETRTVQVPELGDGQITVRGLTAGEVQKLHKLGGKILIHANDTKELDMSSMASEGGSLLFAYGWVDDEGKNVINPRHKKEFDLRVKEISTLPNSVVDLVAGVVRELTGLDDDDVEEKDEDFLAGTSES